MFKKNYDWIDEYIKSNENRPLTAGAFEILKKELETQSNTIQKLRYELKKYKAPIRKKK